jgi:hypothetical protein
LEVEGDKNESAVKLRFEKIEESCIFSITMENITVVKGCNWILQSGVLFFIGVKIH